MLKERQIQLIGDKAIDTFIHGISGKNNEYNTPARLPSFGNLDQYINEALSDMTLGMPFFKAINQDDITSASKFNANVLSLINDFTILNDEAISQLYAITRHFALSESEFRKLYAKLVELNTNIDRLLLISRNANGYLYTIADTFDNLDKIDSKRTTALVNTKGGFVQVSEASVNKVDLSHYTKSTSPDGMKISTI